MRNKLVPIYFLAVNLLAFALMGVDKSRAVRGGWRIPEVQLFLFPLLGGAPGGLLGMLVFHHKTRKPLFRYGFLALTAAEVGLGFWRLFF